VHDHQPTTGRLRTTRLPLCTETLLAHGAQQWPSDTCRHIDIDSNYYDQVFFFFFLNRPQACVCFCVTTPNQTQDTIIFTWLTFSGTCMLLTVVADSDGGHSTT
jgi:hypothetical protein